MADFSCLVVEDSPMMRQLLVFALARIKRIAVTEAEDGVDALRKLANTRFDLVVTDINMPIMNGWEFIEAYEQRHLTPLKPLLELNSAKPGHLLAPHSSLP